MSEGKKFVLGYYVLKSGVPCILDVKLDTFGLLIPSRDEQVTVFLRGEHTLWGVKTRVQRAVERTERRSEDLAQCTHLDWNAKTRALFRSGKYSIHPCRNPQLLTQIPFQDSQRLS